ncbi:hypothetical protein JL721_7758 [Aureococcus anophagefferens]|nr:hypothetical protein JL721_7758 [Aureococcus anophagefferens]
MAAPAEGVTFSSWARSPQPEWPYKLVEPDTAPKLTPTSVTARIAIVDALYAHAKPADDPRLPIPTPAKKRPGGPSPGAAAPPGDARAARRRQPGVASVAAAGAHAREVRHAAAFAHMVESNGLEAVVEDFLALTPMGARLLRRAGAAPARRGRARQGRAEARRLRGARAAVVAAEERGARAASPAVAEDYCAPCEAPAPAPEAAGRPQPTAAAAATAAETAATAATTARRRRRRRQRRRLPEAPSGSEKAAATAAAASGDAGDGGGDAAFGSGATAAEQPPALTPPPPRSPATTETPVPPPAADGRPAAADAPPPATADRPRTVESEISSEPRMLEIAGANGAIVRARPDLKSDVVGELDQGTPVFYTGTRTRIGERVRIEIDAPLEGWVSLALCGPCDAAPSGGIP